MVSNFDFKNTEQVVLKTTSQTYLLDLTNLANDSVLNFWVEQDARCTLMLLGFGKITAHLQLNLNLVGSGAEVKVVGALFLVGESMVKIQSSQNHFAPNTTSNLKIRTVLKDQILFDYQGTIHIATNASNTNANQENKNLILTGTPKVISIPNIEVLNQDVRCGHGSAVGHVDATQLFYLMGRGLNQSEATRMLIDCFLNEELLFDPTFIHNHIENCFLETGN